MEQDTGKKTYILFLKANAVAAEKATFLRRGALDIESLKNYLKRYRLAHYVNEIFKIRATKRRYNLLCRRYGTPSILDEPMCIRKLGQELWQTCTNSKLYYERKPKVLYVGTDLEQDRSGIIQGLSKIADVTLFEHMDGHYGQRYPNSGNEVESVREHNGKRLMGYLKRAGQQMPFDLIIGQMWGLSMHWRALAEARERGVVVVNIVMDDRHAFLGRKLADNTHGGTLGLAPYLSLACTDAPECVKWYEEEGCKAIYFPEASDPDIFHPFPGPKRYDACFVGANYGIRAKLVQAMERSGIRVQVYGNGWPKGRISTDQVPDLFAHSRIVLGCGTIGYCEDFPALKLRDFDGPMSGSFYLTYDNPDIYPLFAVGEEIATYDSIPKAVASARYFLDHPEEMDKMAAAARKRAVASHTWEQRFRFLLSQLKKAA